MIIFYSLRKFGIKLPFIDNFAAKIVQKIPLRVISDIINKINPKGIISPGDNRDGRTAKIAEIIPTRIPVNSTVRFSINIRFSIMLVFNPMACSNASSPRLSNIFLVTSNPIPIVPMINPKPPRARKIDRYVFSRF